MPVMVNRCHDVGVGSAVVTAYMLAVMVGSQ
ncbi:MAG: hypothetical protein BWY94_01563 [Actinobacteria bacterium ADurb.BinA094]|nr:MAG: hypothetical protein BWY94_01563 [Actinobacteria bacterium ADurb.BinA094]